MSNEQTWLVTYDIEDPKRLKRVAKILEAHGLRLQKSVFECLLRPEDLKRLMNKLENEIEEELDGIKFFPLCKACVQKVTVLGPEASPNQQVAPFVVE